MHLAANLGAGNTDANLPRFRLYRDNLENIRSVDDSSAWAGGPASACRRRCASTAPAGTRAPTTATRAAIAAGPPEWNRRNLTTGANVSLAMWRHYLATDDRTFLEHNYPLHGRRGALPARLRGRGRRRQAAHLAVERARDAVGRRGPDHRPPRDEDAVPDRGRGRDAARPRRARSSRSCRPRSRRSSTSRPRRATARTCSPTRRTRWRSCATSRTSTSRRSSRGTR